MPIKFQLRKYLESTSVLKTVLEHLKPSGDGYIRTVVDGSMWKQRTAQMGTKLVIPINLFFDDFTTTDTVSPHASTTSICGIYYYIPCLPGYVLSKLVNILVAGYVLSEDRKSFSNEELFTTLVDTLIDLEISGLEVNYEGNQIHVYFMLAFVTGDNLGLSGILDLAESVRAHYYCRRCKRNREQREEDTFEHSNSLRTVQNYEYDLQLQDVSRTGIKHSSIFNKIPSFHLVYNVYFDLMHDLWEGVCMYGLGHCLNYFIHTKKYFRLDELNRRKNMFVFGNLNSSNVPNDIKDINLSKSKVKMTANEVKTFITFLPLIIGDKIPTNDEVWLYFCNLLKICHILMLREISSNMIDALQRIISDHHTQYLKLFNDCLKPKHHNLVHYPSFLVCSGTPRHQWAMRGEAKHKDAKQYCRSNNNKLNLCKSLSIKSCYKFAYNIVNEVFIPPTVDLTESRRTLIEVTVMHKQFLGQTQFIQNNSITCIDKFIKYGTVYSKGTIFYTSRSNYIRMYELHSIVVDEQNNIVVIGSKIQYISFDEHLQSFEMSKTSTMEAIHNINAINMKAVNLHRFNEKLYYRFCHLNVNIE